MSRFAVITDVHADLHALSDALAAIDKLGIDTIYCCGDLIDYGLFPEETIALLRDRRVLCVRGNHDRWALLPGGSGWDLNRKAIKFLTELPTERRFRVGETRVLVTHARPGDDMRGLFVDTPYRQLDAILDDAAVDVLIVGHTHLPFVRRLGMSRVVMNPGALLRDPEEGCEVSAPGAFVEVDIPRGRFEVHRLPRH